jgi:hypothetical protein
MSGTTDTARSPIWSNTFQATARVIKFFLHLSKDEQRKRFIDRIDTGKKLEIQRCGYRGT